MNTLTVAKSAEKKSLYASAYVVTYVFPCQDPQLCIVRGKKKSGTKRKRRVNTDAPSQWSVSDE